MHFGHLTDLNWKDTVKICEQIASAVNKVHEKQLVIVDIKPENILLDQVLNFTRETNSSSAILA